MKTLILYDSVFGNTLKVAEMIENHISGETSLKHFGEVTQSMIDHADVLVVGSPTRGFMPTDTVRHYLKHPEFTYEGKPCFVFDTRMDPEDVNSSILRFFMRRFKHAGDRMHRYLEKKGARLPLPPIGFYVTGREGPLQESTLDEVKTWTNSINECLNE